jgi:chorismate mutase/prephenate dehydratase
MTDSEGLNSVRAQIAAIDRNLVLAIEERARLSKKIRGMIEAERGAIDVDEQAWLEGLEKQASGELSPAALRAIFRTIRAEARAIEQAARVAYLGPEGTFCYLVAEAAFGTEGSFIECASAVEAFDEVVRGRALFAVVPFESSAEGIVQPTLNALAQTELVLVGERSLPARYDLLSAANGLESIRKVYATATAHAACERFVARELPNAAVVDVRSPVQAVSAAASEPACAAIVPGGVRNGPELPEVRSNVGDLSDLTFRYTIAGSRPAMRSGDDTTCMLFGVDDSPGSLFDVLRHFAERGVNLKKLHSRPARSDSWDYLFYVEVSGHVTDRAVVTAIEAVKRSTRYLKVLGSFPTYR